MKFSDRIGVTKPKEIIQLKGMDTTLRNKLWNVFYQYVADPLFANQYNTVSNTPYGTFFIQLWHDFFEQPIDTIPSHKNSVISSIRAFFFEASWFNIYNFIDFIFKKCENIDSQNFKNSVNNILEKELSGYRYIQNELVPISNDTEIKEIEDAVNKTKRDSLIGINIHLNSALTAFADKERQNYRTVIKESISAVEATVQLISKDEKADLGKALKILKDKIQIHGALESGFKSIYGYTSDADGIRHALLEKDNLDIEDAKFMLVSCSAFINYLIDKAEKSNIDFN